MYPLYWTTSKEGTYHNSEFCFGGDDGIVINEDGSMTFADFDTANGQDINYLYLFYPETQKWFTFK